MLQIFLQILPLFLIMMIGGVFGLFNTRFNEHTVSELNRYAYYIGFPGIIIHSFLSIEKVPRETVILAVANVGVLMLYSGAVLLLARLLTKSKVIRNTFFICVFFGNVAYLGFPLISSLGEQYNTSLSLHIAGYLVVLFTFGVAVLEFSKNQGRVLAGKLLKSVLLNPLLLATCTGLLILGLNLPVPALGQKVIGMIAASASPVVLFALGIFMAKTRIARATLVQASLISLIKLLVLPLVFGLVSWLVFPGTDMTVSIVMAAMPVAITPFVLAEIYDMDKKVIASAIVISTVLSVGIIPAVVGLV